MKRDEHLDRRSVGTREAWAGMRGQRVFDSGLFHRLSNDRWYDRFVFWNAYAFRGGEQCCLGQEVACSVAGTLAGAQFETTEQNINATRQKWKDFEKNTRNQPADMEPSIEPGADDLTRNQPAFIELTADDLNNLIARIRHLRDKAFVTIEDNRLRIRMSVPVGEYVREGNYYLNADIVITSEGRQSLDNPRVSGIIVNNQSLPSDVLDWKYDGRPLRDYLGQHGAALRDDTIEIRDGKVIIYRRD